MTDLRAPLPRIDWRQYFRDFCEAHGRFGLELRERLVFPDGWSYNPRDYKGPEWPPPDDPREKFTLILEYWQRRKAAVKTELARAQLRYSTAAEAIQVRSVPIPTVSYVRDEEGQVQAVRGHLDLADLQGRVDWLKEDLALAEQGELEAKQELALLRMPDAHATNGSPR